jgi:hypothetical protein
MILRRHNSINNNGITTSHRREKAITNVKIPPIGNKQQTIEQV